MRDRRSTLSVPIQLSDESVSDLLTGEGWPYEKLTDDVWRSRFRGETTELPVLIHYDRPNNSVRFAVAPILKSPEDKALAEKLYSELMRLNHEMVFAKYSIDDDLDVMLSVEYPAVSLDNSEFFDALQVITHYADQHIHQLQTLVS